MKTPSFSFRSLATAMLSVATIAAAAPWCAIAADPEVPAASAAAPAEYGAAEEGIVTTLGSSDQKVHVVVRGGLWSMHAETVLVQNILKSWHEAGGPEVVMKNPVDHAYTLSVHRVTTERLVERLLEGYGYTLHYAADGTLETVRVYSPEPGYPFKNPRVVESFGTWRQVETAQATLPDGRSEGVAVPAAAGDVPARP